MAAPAHRRGRSESDLRFSALPGSTMCTVSPEEAPDEFWVSLAYATNELCLNPVRWSMWAKEYLWAMGWRRFQEMPAVAYENLVAYGVANSAFRTPGERLSAVEHVLDLFLPDERRGFEVAVSEKARWLRVGVAVESGRFIPLQSEHLHQEIVQPTLPYFPILSWTSFIEKRSIGLFRTTPRGDHRCR